jgi:hypothetical protein
MAFRLLPYITVDVDERLRRRVRFAAARDVDPDCRREAG